MNTYNIYSIIFVIPKYQFIIPNTILNYPNIILQVIIPFIYRNNKEVYILIIMKNLL